MSDPTGKTRIRRPDIPRAATARTVQRAKYCQSKLNRTPPTRRSSDQLDARRSGPSAAMTGPGSRWRPRQLLGAAYGRTHPANAAAG